MICKFDRILRTPHHAHHIHTYMFGPHSYVEYFPTVHNNRTGGSRRVGWTSMNLCVSCVNSQSRMHSYTIHRYITYIDIETTHCWGYVCDLDKTPNMKPVNEHRRCSMLLRLSCMRSIYMRYFAIYWLFNMFALTDDARTQQAPSSLVAVFESHSHIIYALLMQFKRIANVYT